MNVYKRVMTARTGRERHCTMQQKYEHDKRGVMAAGFIMAEMGGGP